MKTELPSYNEIIDNPVTWEDVKPGMLLFTYGGGDGAPMLFYITYKSERGVAGTTYELIYHILIDRKASLEKEEYIHAHQHGDYFVDALKFPGVCYYTIDKIFEAEDFEVFN